MSDEQLRSLGPLLGQGEDWDRALASVRAGSAHHAFLFEGPPGIGKTTAALEFAAAALGIDPADEIGRRRLARDNHPDLHWVERPEDKQDIPVESVRGLRETLSRTAVEGGARVAIVDPADALNEQGQNALLKTLEEPGERTFLLLTAVRPEGLLDTVRSRLRRFRLRSLDDETLTGFAQKPPEMSASQFAEAVSAADGSLGRLRWLLDPETRELRDKIAIVFAEAPADEVGQGRALLSGVSGRDETRRRALTVCAVARALCRDALRNGLAEDRSDSYPSPPVEPWLDALEQLFRAEEDLRLGIPAGQALDAALWHCVEAAGRAASVPAPAESNDP